MKTGVGSHQGGTSLIFDGTGDDRSDGRQRVAFMCDQREVITLADVDNPGLNSRPDQDTVVRWLSTPARIEGTAIQHDPELGIAGHHHGLPGSKVRVDKFEAISGHRDLSPCPGWPLRPRRPQLHPGRGTRRRGLSV